MAELRSICVYCGANTGARPEYAAAAEALGRALARSGTRLVYGGGAVGLMGILARAVMKDGGDVTGIIPQFLKDREVMLREVDDLIVTADMHERKRIMFERADAFVALPGGIGTLEELVEQLTWAQLGRHRKPIAVANIKRFWDPLLSLFDHMRGVGFIRNDLEINFLVVDRVADLLPQLNAAAQAAAKRAVPEKPAAAIEQM